MIGMVIFMTGFTHLLGQNQSKATLSVNNPRMDNTLRTYQKTAAENNPSLLQKWSEYQAALQKVPQVSSLPNPDLNLGFFLTPMELPGGNQVADLQLMQMFPWFGVIRNAKDEMSLMAKASFASVEAVKLQVYYEVRSSWFNLYRNREQVRITQQNLELLRQIERLATSRYKAGGTGSSVSVSSSAGSMPTAPVAASGNGMGMTGSTASASQAVTVPMASPSMGTSTGSSLSDIYTLQLEENELINSIASLNDQYQNLLFKFNKLLNRSVESPVVLPEKDFKDSLEPPLDSALKNNPMLTMLQFERESLEARRKMSDRMGYPMVGIGLKYSILAKNPASTSMMNGQDMLMPMVSVSLPIYRKKYKAIQQETEWLKTASVQNYEATLNLMQSDYQDALFNYRDAQRRIQLNESQLKLTEKTYQLQLKRFAISTAELSELLTISRQQLDYALKGFNARMDLLIAQAKIRQLTAFN